MAEPRFRIYEPMLSVRPDSHVIITTYGIAPDRYMSPVIKELQRAKSVTIVVGYIKTVHDLETLKLTLYRYKYDLGFRIKLWVGFHAKIWAIDERVWCGSMNFVQGTAPNYMAEVTDTKNIFEYLKLVLTYAQDFSRTTKLELVKQHEQY